MPIRWDDDDDDTSIERIHLHLQTMGKNAVEWFNFWSSTKTSLSDVTVIEKKEEEDNDGDIGSRLEESSGRE